MSGFTRPLARLIDQFEQLPGIGPRTAQRLALYLLRQPEETTKAFANALISAREQVGQCQTCFHLSAEPECDICKNSARNKGLLCVVADSRDLLALERTREYKGVYHVLGGLISPMDGIGPELLQISSLVNRVDSNEIKEVIDKATFLIKKNGKFFLEIGSNQKNKVCEMLKNRKFYINKALKDYGNNYRCIISTKL